jgi:hypothetical protein
MFASFISNDKRKMVSSRRISTFVGNQHVDVGLVTLTELKTDAWYYYWSIPVYITRSTSRLAS